MVQTGRPTPGSPGHLDPPNKKNKVAVLPFYQSSNKDFHCIDFYWLPFGSEVSSFPWNSDFANGAFWPRRSSLAWETRFTLGSRCVTDKSSHCRHQSILAFRQWKLTVDGLVVLALHCHCCLSASEGPGLRLAFRSGCWNGMQWKPSGLCCMMGQSWFLIEI